MININELEARWLKYKIKSFIPHVVILLSIIIIATVFILFNTKTGSKEISKPVKKTTTKELIEKTLKEPKDKPLKTQIEVPPTEEALKVKPQSKPLYKDTPQVQPVIEPISVARPYYEPHKNTLSPSLDFMSKLQGDTLPYFDTDSQESTTNKSRESSQKPTIKKVEKKVVLAPIQQIVKKNSIQIDRQNTHDDINQVVKRFKKNNNPALSLFIAKKYYQLGEYHQSYNYSLMTNEIDNDIEASWIIFAKSLVKLNEKSMAIETLKKYISHSNSHRAKILLDDITSGKFK